MSGVRCQEKLAEDPSSLCELRRGTQSEQGMALRAERIEQKKKLLVIRYWLPAGVSRRQGADDGKTIVKFGFRIAGIEMVDFGYQIYYNG